MTDKQDTFNRKEFWKNFLRRVRISRSIPEKKGNWYFQEGSKSEMTSGFALPIPRSLSKPPKCFINTSRNCLHPSP